MNVKDHEQTLVCLRELATRFRLEFDDMSKHAAYEAFAASPQHAEWLEFLAQRKKDRKDAP